MEEKEQLLLIHSKRLARECHRVLKSTPYTLSERIKEMETALINYEDATQSYDRESEINKPSLKKYGHFSVAK